MSENFIRQPFSNSDNTEIKKFQIRKKEVKTYPSGLNVIEFGIFAESTLFKGTKIISGKGSENYEQEVRMFYQDVQIGEIYEMTVEFFPKYRSYTIYSMNKTNDYDLKKFVKIPFVDGEVLMNQLFSIISELKNIHLKNLCEFIFKDSEFTEKFKNAPSAKYFHHAYSGGNLEHTVAVTKICKELIDFYKVIEKARINGDLLLVGAIFHDVGKVFSLKVNNGVVYKTEIGYKIGHLDLGRDFVRDAINHFKDFPEELKVDLMHLILSHHGRASWGSPVRPQTPEAEILHFADLLDSRFKKQLEGKSDRDPLKSI